MPSPNDHVKTIVEMLRGETPDLLRRWLSALLLVPQRDRDSIVAAVERRIVSEYPHEGRQVLDATSDQIVGDPAQGATDTPRRVRIVSPPKQRDGYTEQVERVYEVVDEHPSGKAKRAYGRPKAPDASRGPAKPRRNSGSA